MMKIMYVEDNPANISLLQRIARMGGHQVINYTNGEVALNNFAQDDPDLVLMDLQLEGRITGLDVVKQLRARGFKTPIVAVTAYAMVGDRERCIEAGCNSYLSKPLPVAELVELVKDYESKSADKANATATPDAEAPPSKRKLKQKRRNPAASTEIKVEVKTAAEPPATEAPTEPSVDAKPNSNRSAERQDRRVHDNAAQPSGSN